MISSEDKLFFSKHFQGRFREMEPLSLHTSLGIGGPAAGLVEVQTTQELSLVLGRVHQQSLKKLVVGGGTNLLISDDGFDGLVIRVNLEGIEFNEKAGVIRAGAGVSSAGLVEWAIERGLGGLEFAAGLPGTVGGAVAGNAGCYGCSFGDRLISATVVENNGTLLDVHDPNWFEFEYRHSKLEERDAVLADVTLRVTPANKEDLREASDEHLLTRATRHPAKGAKTAGSYFKNLPPEAPGARRTAAGLLLDQCGVKGLHVGDAAVFEKHANILVNHGNATAKDVLDLATQMSKLVREKFNIELEPEVRFVGTRPNH